MESVLLTRIDNLIRLLKVAHDSDIWWTRLSLAEQEGLSRRLWRGVLRSIYTEAEKYILTLQLAREELESGVRTERETWHLYEQMLSRSEAVFRECLELLGGLTLRARIHDRSIANIYRLSDALIKEVADNLTTPDSFAIPGPEETVASTMRRVARVRFPESTLWTLPLIAYEYAYVAMDEPTLRRQPEEFARLLQTWLATEDKDAVRLRARVLLADSLATYTLGPSYACSALILRFQPFDRTTATRPSDIDRAAMVLGVLRSLGSQTLGIKTKSPFVRVHKALQERWISELSVTGAGPPGVTEPVPPLDPLMVLRAFDSALIGEDKAFGTSGWGRARSDAIDLWGQLVNAAADLEFPSSNTGPHELRDVLNSAWYARLGVTGSGETLPGLNEPLPPNSIKSQLIDKLEDAATRHCLQLVPSARPPSPQAPLQSGASAGRKEVS